MNNAAVIQSLKEKLRHRWPGQGMRSGIAGIDELLGPAGLARGAIHEVLSPTRRHVPRFFALVLARAMLGSGAIVWCCEKEEGTAGGSWYPPAAAAMGIPAARLILLRPGDTKQTLWAIAECLRCKGVSVTIGRLREKLGSLDARRLQLAAEAGGGAGVLLRPTGSDSVHYAAATRWLVEPAPGEPHIQRWKVTLLHGGSLALAGESLASAGANSASAAGRAALSGHGRHIDSSIGLEVHRETHHVQTYSLHPSQKLADQPAQTAAARRGDAQRRATG